MPQNPPSPEDVNLPLPGEAVQDTEAGYTQCIPRSVTPTGERTEMPVTPTPVDTVILKGWHQ